MPDSARSPSFLILVNWPVDVPGGVNEVVLNLALELEKSQAFRAVVVVAAWQAGAAAVHVRGCEVVTLRLRDPFGSPNSLRLLLSALPTWPLDAFRLWRFLRRRNVVAINAQFPNMTVGPFLLLKLLHAFQGRLILTFQGADVTAIASAPPWQRALWRRAIAFADAAAACSRDLAGKVRTLSPSANVVPIHNGADLALFTRRPQQRPPGHTILHIGKYEHKKSQDVLLLAFQQLLRDVPDARLVLVGATGPTLPQVRRLVAELGLQQQVDLHVDVPHHHIPALMHQADLFVLPSRSEPFGIVLVEAGAAGLPVVAARVGGIPELIDHGATGLLVEPGDAPGLAAAMASVLLDPARAHALALAWHQKATLHWGWDKMCGRYLALLSQLDSPRMPAS